LRPVRESEGGSGLSALSGIVVSLIYLVGQYTAISIVLVWLFGIPHWQALLISGIIITAYTVVGGLYAVSWTTPDPGGILIVGVLLMAPFVIASAGGLSHINTVLAGGRPELRRTLVPEPCLRPHTRMRRPSSSSRLGSS